MTWETILTIVLVGAALYFLMSRIGCGASASGSGGGCCGHAGHILGGSTRMDHDEHKDPAVERDPVCGMVVAPDHAAASADYMGKTYRFCSVQCRDNFQSTPNRYVSKEPLGTGGHNE